MLRLQMNMERKEVIYSSVRSHCPSVDSVPPSHVEARAEVEVWCTERVGSHTEVVGPDDQIPGEAECKGSLSTNRVDTTDLNLGLT